MTQATAAIASDASTQEKAPKNFANRRGYSETDPFEIVRVVSDKIIEVRPMAATLDPTWKPQWSVGGFAGHCHNQHEQRWIITPDESAPVIRLHKRKDGYFYHKSSSFSLSDTPRKFYDYNF